MPTPFAALEQRINAAVERHLANREADFGGAVGVVAGIFRNEYAESFGIAGSGPVFECDAARVAGVAAGASVTIGGIAYTVAAVRPDGSGMVTFTLEEA